MTLNIFILRTADIVISKNGNPITSSSDIFYDIIFYL